MGIDRVNFAMIIFVWQINPSGQHLTEGFWFTGGIPHVQLQLKEYLHLDVMTVTGRTLGESLENLEKPGLFMRYVGYLASCHAAATKPMPTATRVL